MKDDKRISLDTDTFESLKQDFDAILNKTLGNMEKKGADEATITVKVSVKLGTDTKYTKDGSYIDFIKPNFKHEVNSVMQVKDKKTGQLNGDMALVYDDDTEEYVLRPMYDGQMSFDGDGIIYDGVGNANEVVVEGEAIETVDVPLLESKEEQPEEKAESTADQSARFKYLMQFVGEQLEVVEDEGCYRVRTVNGKMVILGSDRKEDSVSYIPEDLAKRYVGHQLECAGYGIGKHIVNVAIECVDLGEVVFDIDEAEAESA